MIIPIPASDNTYILAMPRVIVPNSASDNTYILADFSQAASDNTCSFEHAASDSTYILAVSASDNTHLFFHILRFRE